MEKARTVLQIRLEKELKEEFDRLCDERCINKSNLIRKMIVDWMAQQQNPESKSI